MPLALCLVYSIGAFGSIGPWVPAWGLAILVCAPFAAYLPLARQARNAGKQLILAAASVPVGVAAAVLSANTLMLLSYQFGLYDYAQM